MNLYNKALVSLFLTEGKLRVGSHLVIPDCQLMLDDLKSRPEKERFTILYEGDIDQINFQIAFSWFKYNLNEPNAVLQIFNDIFNLGALLGTSHAL